MENNFIKIKLGLLQLAQQLGNVSQACKIMGYSRDSFYRLQELLQQDLDEWMQYYNNERPHSGRYCYGKTPMETFIESLPLATEKLLYNKNEAA